MPKNLRSDLQKPQGKLIKGTAETTIPLIVKELESVERLIIGVGDVTADLLINNGLRPNIVITDGLTKRQKLKEWKKYVNYREVSANCPPGKITVDAWQSIRSAIHSAIENNHFTHIKIDGEEDLLVIPAILELPTKSVVIYGQPNEGAVIVSVNKTSRKRVQNIVARMSEY